MFPIYPAPGEFLTDIHHDDKIQRTSPELLRCIVFSAVSAARHAAKGKLWPTLICCLFSLVSSLVVQGQTAQRTFVSTSGSDANTTSLCGAANPCRNFAAAQSVTTAGGEIIALTSGGYGPVEITKAIQITAPTGVYAAITAQPNNAIGGTDAIRISAGMSDVVVLRGLTLNNLGANNGINFDSGLTLHVEGCVLNGFTNGILFDVAGRLFVKDTLVRNGTRGAVISSTSGTIQGTIDRSRFANNSSHGVTVDFNAKVTIADSMVLRNGGNGVVVSNGAHVTAIRTLSANNEARGFVATFDAATRLIAAFSVAANNGGVGFQATFGPQMVLDNCVSKGNSTGVGATGSSTTGSPTIVRVSNTTVTDNGTGFSNSLGAVFETYGNNYVRGNTTPTSGAITVVGEI